MARTEMTGFNRRVCLALLIGTGSSLAAPQERNSEQPKDWVCPMDPDYRSDKPGVCPRCGMKLVVQVPDRVEYPLQVTYRPDALHAGDTVELTFRVLNPFTGYTVQRFETVHEKLMHLFIVSENLEYFAHVHPLVRADGSFFLTQRLPYGGMYRLLADYYPAGSAPQLALYTLFVSGDAAHSEILPSLAPCRSENLTVSLRPDPFPPVVGLETKLIYELTPAAGLERYLGVWGHMLIVSSDLIDLLHLHPFLADGGPVIQFNVIFPRQGLYRIWTQFQHEGVVNTAAFTLRVNSL